MSSVLKIIARVHMHTIHHDIMKCCDSVGVVCIVGTDELKDPLASSSEVPEVST